MAEALVRHDELIADAVEARGGSLVKSMGEGDATVSVFDSRRAAVEAALAADGSADRRGVAARRPSSPSAGASTRARPSGATPTTSVPPSTSPLACAARPTAARSSLSSVTAELVAAHLPDGCSLVDLGLYRFARLGARERVLALAGPASAPLPATECPYRGLLAFEADDRASSSGAKRWSRSSSAAPPPAGCSPWSARRAAASPRCCAPDSSAPRRRAGRRGHQRGAVTPGRHAGVGRAGRARWSPRRRPVRGAVHPLRPTRRGVRRSSTRCWRARAGRRSAFAPTSTAGSAPTRNSREPSPATRCCSGP